MPQVLATDLDGTLIPLSGNPHNRRDLHTLRAGLAHRDVPLIYVTGRHLASVQRAMREHELPAPRLILCDVGTTLLEQREGNFHPLGEYREQLVSLSGAVPLPALRSLLADVGGLRLQEPEKQGEFKLSYFCSGEALAEIEQQVLRKLQEHGVPWTVVASIDPYNAEGLVDLLPRSVSKAYALQWWGERFGTSPEDVIYAGDSGNDTAALTSGCRAIVVGNAHESVVTAVKQSHAAANTLDRLYLAAQPATSGVLEGCRHFGVVGGKGN